MLKLSVHPTDNQRLTMNYNYYDGRGGSSYDLKEQRLVAAYELAPEDSPWLDFKASVQGLWRDNSIVVGYLDSDDEFASYGVSMQNTSRFDFGDNVRNSLTYGVDYYRDRQTSVDNTTGLADSSRPNAKSTDLGLFIQDEITIMDFLTITPALRYTSYSRSSDDNLAEDQEDAELTPKISALAQVTPWLGIFGSYAESYRAPSLDEIYFAMEYPGGMVAVVPNPDLKPESAKTWEMGFNLDFESVFTHNDPLFIKAVYFQETVKDFINATQISPAGQWPMLFSSVNVGKVNRYGFEVEAAYQYENMNLTLSYGKVVGRDDETDSLTGGTPETINFRAGYFFTDLDLTVFWKSKFASEYKTTDAWGDSLKYDAYDVHGIGFSWEPSQEAWEGFRVDAGIDNLFDKRYFNEYGGVEMGQNYKLTFSYRF